MNFNLQTIKSIIESNGIEVGFVNKPIVKDIDGNEYQLRTYKVSYGSNWYGEWKGIISNILQDKSIGKILIYNLGIDMNKSYSGDIEDYVRSFRFVGIGEDIKFDKDEVLYDTNAQEDENKPRYELDGNQHISVKCTNSGEIKNIPIKDLLDNFDNKEILGSNDKYYTIKNVTRGTKQDIYRYSFHHSGNSSLDDNNVIQCSFDQEGFEYEESVRLPISHIQRIRYIDRTGKGHFKFSERVEERFLYNDFVYSIDIDCDELVIDDLYLSSIDYEFDWSKHPHNQV